VSDFDFSDAESDFDPVACFDRELGLEHAGNINTLVAMIMAAPRINQPK
jgi:hypothetical protein